MLFGLCFSVALLRSLADFVAEIHFGREKDEHAKAPNDKFLCVWWVGDCWWVGRLTQFRRSVFWDNSSRPNPDSLVESVFHSTLGLLSELLRRLIHVDQTLISDWVDDLNRIPDLMVWTLDCPGVDHIPLKECVDNQLFYVTETY